MPSTVLSGINIGFFSAAVNPFLFLTFISHALKYSSRSSSNHCNTDTVMNTPHWHSAPSILKKVYAQICSMFMLGYLQSDICWINIRKQIRFPFAQPLLRVPSVKTVKESIKCPEEPNRLRCSFISKVFECCRHRRA